jgi:hypothetical protein
MNSKIQLQTPKGLGILGFKGEPSFFISELGFVMMRVWNESQNSWTNIKVSDVKDILPKGYSIIEDKQEINEQPEQTATLGRDI